MECWECLACAESELNLPHGTKEKTEKPAGEPISSEGTVLVVVHEGSSDGGRVSTVRRICEARQSVLSRIS